MRSFAWLWPCLVAGVGCGSVKSDHLPDAPGAGDDAPTRGTVQVTVLDPSGAGAPAVGANVVFIDPDGTLVKRVATDTNGAAEAEVLPGASVTSIVLNNMSYQLQTVLAVKPGDNVVLGFKNSDSTLAGNFTISYPAYGAATSYVIVSPCGTSFVSAPAAGGPPPAATMPIYNYCRQNAMELIVVAQDANGPLASIEKTNVAFSSGGSTTISGSYQSLRTLTSSYTNINPNITTLTMNRSIPDAFGFNSGESVSMPGTTAVVMVSGPPGTGGQILTTVGNATRSGQSIRQTLSGMAATYGLDLGATLLPWINTPTFDGAAGKLVVPLDATGTSNAKPDLFRVTAVYRRTDVNGLTTNFSWTLFGPEAGDLVLPALPADLAGIRPTASDTVTATSASMLEADSVTGYDAIRNDLNAAFSLYSGSRPPAGTVRFSRSPLIRL